MFDILEKRMSLGEFTIIDATHTKRKDIDRYKKLARDYRYRVWCIDFSSIPIEVAKRQNKLRPSWKWVPDDVIDNMYARFATESVPKWVTVLTPEEAANKLLIRPLDFSKYKKIHHIGDIHGCYTALKQYFTDDYKLNNDELYIFVGDYCDRGTENAEVLRFLFSIMDNPNVILLEGNHETSLWRWARDLPAFSKEFNQVTKLELESKGIDKKRVRELYRLLRTMVFYEYNSNLVMVTHGGLPKIASGLYLQANFMTVSATQLIKGVGGYSTNIDHKFNEYYGVRDTRAPLGIYQVHGHRNILNLPIINGNSINLEGHVEFWGHLRVAVLSKDGWATTEIKNNVAKPKYARAELAKTETEVKVQPERKEFTNQTLLTALLANDNIRQNRSDNIVAFNFKRSVFEDGSWDEQTIKARGLLINVDTTEIVARSYDKFFNAGERPETTQESLAENLKFPVTAWVKYNGFLGILGYDSSKDQLIFASKSGMGTDYAQWFREIFYETSRLDNEGEFKLKKYLRDNNVSLVFEVMDIKRDPHIIEYHENHVVLLEVIKRQPEFQSLGYEEVRAVAEELKVPYKVLGKTLHNWEEYVDCVKHIQSDDFFFSKEVEGYVIEDAAGFKIKIKLPWYKFWKHMRSIKQLMCFGSKVPTGSLLTPLANEFYGWLRKQTRSTLRRSIIDLRNKFYKEKETGIVCIPCPASGDYKECVYFGPRNTCLYSCLEKSCGRSICCGYCESVGNEKETTEDN
jgi:hypothetical protein